MQTRSSTPGVAFLGLGLMGRPMAMRLAEAGLAPCVWNRSPLDLAQMEAAGAVLAADPAEAVREADIVCLCLSNAEAVEAVVFGPRGIAEAVRPGALVVDLSSISATTTRALASRLAQAASGGWVDAPVSGGVAGAEAGTLAIFCGGAEADVAAAEPVLRHLAARISRMGGVGAGQATKACNQLIVSAAILAIAEAVRLGRAMDIDVARLPEVLAGGFADSAPLRIFGPRMTAADPGPAVGRIATMLKDVKAAQAEAMAGGVRLPLLAELAELYGRAAEKGLAEQDLSALAHAEL